jgi:hypothetical protein
MRLAGAFVGCGGAVAAQHRAGLPAGKSHQVSLVATLGQPIDGRTCGGADADGVPPARRGGLAGGGPERCQTR